MDDLPRIAAYRMQGAGRASAVSLEQLNGASSPDEPASFTWIHLQRDDPAAAQWLASSGVDEFALQALVAAETRPRCTIHDNGAIINLRGVNLNPGAEPDDMVSIRFWVQDDRVVSVWVRPLKAIADLFESIQRQRAPASPGDLIAKVAIRLAERAEPTVSDLAERVDALEEALLDERGDVSRVELAAVRRSAIALRRFMTPQREALRTLEIEEFSWLHDEDRSKLREATERIARLGEELDALRDRAKIVHEQISDARAEAMNHNMMILSVVAAIFLPLGLLTGLLGINVGGIPGADNGYAFLMVTALLLVLALVQLILFRRYGILR